MKKVSIKIKFRLARTHGIVAVVIVVSYMCLYSCLRDGLKKEKKLMEFSIKGPDPASQHLNGKKNKIKHGLKML